MSATARTDVELDGDNSRFVGQFNIDTGSALSVNEQKNLGDASVINNGLLTISTERSWAMTHSISGSGDVTKLGTGILTLNNDSAAYHGGEIAFGSDSAINMARLGGDLAQWSSNAQDRWHLGVMAGYANQHSNTQSNHVGYKSDGRISGYSAGLYATWYQNDANKTGAYVDSWALYNWFDNSVSSDNRSADDYTSVTMVNSVSSSLTLKRTGSTTAKSTP